MNKSKNGADERRIDFVAYFLATDNATESAIKAGYSKKTAKQQASRLLKDERVCTLIRTHEHIKAIVENEEKSKQKKETNSASEEVEKINSEFVLKKRIEILKSAMERTPKKVWDYDKGAWVEDGKVISNAKAACMVLRDIENSLDESDKDLSEETIRDFIKALTKV